MEARDTPNLMPLQEPEYLTKAEAARLLRTSGRTIDRRIQSGGLPAKRLKGGKSILLKRDDVLALLEDVRKSP